MSALKRFTEVSRWDMDTEHCSDALTDEMLARLLLLYFNNNNNYLHMITNDHAQNYPNPEVVRDFVTNLIVGLASHLATRTNTPKSKVVSNLYGHLNLTLVRANARSLLLKGVDISSRRVIHVVPKHNFVVYLFVYIVYCTRNYTKNIYIY